MEASRARYFNRIAADYDAHRPTYPDELIDGVVHAAGLGAGDSVLEVGPGTGHLTVALAGRGLDVTAVEPGAALIEVAQAKVPGARFVNASLEDARLEPGAFRAAFAAAAFHWPDPDVSWRIVADALAPGGTFALISHFGVLGDDDQEAAFDVWRAVAPELTATFTPPRTAEALLAGAAERAGNLSELWSFLGGYALAREYAAELFAPAETELILTPVRQTAAQLNALLATMSFWGTLAGEQQQAVAAGNEVLEARLGRPIESHVAAVAVTARRRQKTLSGAPDAEWAEEPPTSRCPPS